jgi:hypothetical protein
MLIVVSRVLLLRLCIFSCDSRFVPWLLADGSQSQLETDIDSIPEEEKGNMQYMKIRHMGLEWNIQSHGYLKKVKTHQIILWR